MSIGKQPFVVRGRGSGFFDGEEPLGAKIRQPVSPESRRLETQDIYNIYNLCFGWHEIKQGFGTSVTSGYPIRVMRELSGE